jgi:hypothetical protein
MAFFDRFLSISSVQDIVWAPTIAFEDFSQFPGKERQLMAVFVLDMFFNGVIYDENRANLGEDIRRLRSMRTIYCNAELCCVSFGVDSLTKTNKS